MTDVQLKLSKNQFKTLLELVYLGNMMANGHRIEHVDKYKEMEELLFSLAPQFGIENCSDEETPVYPSRLFEEGEIRSYIDDYNENTFWEELVVRLTEMMRDRKYSKEQLSAMDQKERFTLFFQCEDRVRIYLAEHGITRFPLHELDSEEV